MTYPIQSNTPVLDSLQTAAFCTEESKTSTTRPYFKRTMTLSGEWEPTWQMEFNPSKCSSMHIMLNKHK